MPLTPEEQAELEALKKEVAIYRGNRTGYSFKRDTSNDKKREAEAAKQPKKQAKNEDSRAAQKQTASAPSTQQSLGKSAGKTAGNIVFNAINAGKGFVKGFAEGTKLVEPIEFAPIPMETGLESLINKKERSKSQIKRGS
jgi:ATPase subunit of ABC transporter with duplicated ATPase domains